MTFKRAWAIRSILSVTASNNSETCSDQSQQRRYSTYQMPTENSGKLVHVIFPALSSNSDWLIYLFTAGANGSVINLVLDSGHIRNNEKTTYGKVNTKRTQGCLSK